MHDPIDSAPQPAERAADAQILADRYRLVRRLSGGAMGDTFEAYDDELARRVAVKVAPEAHLDDAVWLARFARQGRALARVDHPNVVVVFDRGMHAGRQPFVVMEFLEGRDLAQWLAEGMRFSLHSVASLGVQLCRAVEALHHAGVVHRDLKPSNLFVTQRADGSLALKVVDLGIAKVHSEQGLTGTRELLGTLAYVSPEALDGAHDVDGAADMYAAGGVLFELLTGERPFRAHARAALVQAIRHDAPPRMQSVVGALPDDLTELVLALLSKLPAQRPTPSEAATVLARVATDCAARAELPSRADPELGAVLAQRYELRRSLGSGTHGTVYDAFDRKQQMHVALKRLHRHAANDLYRLKREYRTLSELVHPNLVRIDALHLTDDAAFLTMELLTGPDFLASASGSFSAARRLFADVLSGLDALHNAGFVHRDLKPANILLHGDGRAVLLDFGLAVHASAQTDVAGTPYYMAPELVEGRVAPAADLFACGVLLHEALTGQRPSETPIHAPSPEVPPDLASLCTALMQRDPEQRPSARAALAMLASHAGPSAEPASSESGPRTFAAPSPFVGRNLELARLLAEAEEVLETGKLRAVLLRGASGIGKSAVLQQLGRLLPERTLILAGRCREAEAIPYPALDSAIDALSEFLGGLSTPFARSLLPRDIGALAVLFPVLRRVPAVQQAASSASLPRDPQEVRNFAHHAFKELLRRIAEQRPIAFFLDDVHWIDADSAALLAHCLAEPAPPALFLVGALRETDTREAGRFARVVSECGHALCELQVQPLDARSCQELLSRVWEKDTLSDTMSRTIAQQSGGHPFLLTLLATHALQRHALAADCTLEQAILAHAAQLPAAARHVLELLAVSTRPLPRLVLTQLAGPEGHALLSQLRRERLIRPLERGHESRFDVYHARVRDALLSELPAAQKRLHHVALADALAHYPDETDARVEHLRGAGRVEAAAAVAMEAAKSASAQLAFDRAAALYAAALDLGQGTNTQQVALMELQAGAMRSAGRTRAAGRLLQRASAIAEPDEAQRLQREAGRHLLLAGDIEGGLSVLAPVLAAHDLHVPKGFAEVLSVAQSAYLALVARGLTPAQHAQSDTLLRAKLEVSLVLVQALAHADLRGVAFAFQALSWALDIGDEPLLQRAAAMFVICTAAQMTTPLVKPVLELCRRLTPGKGPYAEALCAAAEAEAAHFDTHFVAAEIAFERAERLLLDHCVGATRELATTRNGAVLIQYSQKGDFKTHVARTLSWLTDAEAREDIFHASMLRCAHTIVWIAHDEPERARRELMRAEAEWRDADGLFEVAAVLYYDIIDRYLGDATAHLHPAQGRAHVLTGPAMDNVFLSGYVHLHRAWGSIRALAYAGFGRAERALADGAIAGLRALGPQMWQAVADAYSANLMFLQRDTEAALRALEDSEQTFRGLSMLCLAASARRRRGELAGGAFGTSLVLASDAELRALGVANPERWCRAYFSVYPVALAAEATFLSA